MCILIMLYSIFSVLLVWELKIEVVLCIFTAGFVWVLGGEARSVASPSQVRVSEGLSAYCAVYNHMTFT
jgi:hypothetical protein